MSLTRRQLIDLVSSLTERWTLSVYIDASTNDPAARAAWKTALRNAVDGTRTASPPATRKQLDRAIQQLDAWLATAEVGVGQGRWCAFATEDGVAYAGELSTDAETIVHWQQGAWILPFVAALTHRVPALVVLIDSRSAAIHAYSDGHVESRGAFRVTPHVGDAAHMGDPAGQGFHGGTRGTTRHDAAQRAQLSANRRLLAEVTRAVVEAADADAWIVIGGPRDLPAKLLDHLPPRIRERAVVLPELRRRVSRATIVDAAKYGTALLRVERDRTLLRALLEHSGAHTNAVVGPVATLDAVERGSAACVLLTAHFVATRSGDAERALEGALAEGGEVLLLDGGPAAELDKHGGGIGAMLRFVPAYAYAGAAG